MLFVGVHVGGSRRGRGWKIPMKWHVIRPCWTPVNGRQSCCAAGQGLQAYSILSISTEAHFTDVLCLGCRGSFQNDMKSSIKPMFVPINSLWNQRRWCVTVFAGRRRLAGAILKVMTLSGEDTFSWAKKPSMLLSYSFPRSSMVISQLVFPTQTSSVCTPSTNATKVTSLFRSEVGK